MSDSPHQRWLDTAQLKDNLAERTLRAGSHTAIAQILRGVFEFAATLILARLITPEDFGLIGMVVAITGFIALFRELGLSMATIQQEEITHEQVSSLFWINAGLGVLITIVTGALAPVVGWFYDKPELIPITIALAGAFLLGGVGVQHQALLTRQMYFGRRSAVELVAGLGSVAVGITLGWLGYGYWALVAKIVVSPLLMTLGFWIACSWRPSKPGGALGLGALLKFGGNLTGFSVINYCARNMDDILIAKFQDARVLGLYQEGYKILMLPLTQLNAPIGAVAVPALSRLSDQPERYRRAYTRLLEKVLLLTMPLGALFVGCSDSIVVVVLGDQWVDTGPILFWLGFLVFTQPIGNSTGWLFITQDRTDHMLRWGLIGAALAVISFVVGLPWGAVGVAASYSISGIFLRTPILLWMVGKTGPVKTRDIYRSVFAPAVAGLASLTVLLWMRLLGLGLAPIWDALLGIGLTVITSLLTLLLLPSGRAALRDAQLLVKEIREKKFAAGA